MAFVIPAGAIAPAALAKAAAERTNFQWVTYEVRQPLEKSPISGNDTLCGNEEKLEFVEIRRYEDVNILSQRRKPYEKGQKHRNTDIFPGVDLIKMS
jgi:hypothetical protein